MNNRNYVKYNVWQYTPYAFLFYFLLCIGSAEAKEVIGTLEKVKIGNTDLIFNSKIDTGAKNSSLNAKDIRIINKGNETWIKFNVTNNIGKSATLEKPLKRFVEIKRKGTGSQKRPAILLDVCLGKISKLIEVNLVNRSNFDYQMLIGRSFLHGTFIVDVDLSYTSDPRC